MRFQERTVACYSFGCLYVRSLYRIGGKQGHDSVKSQKLTGRVVHFIPVPFYLCVHALYLQFRPLYSFRQVPHDVAERDLTTARSHNTAGDDGGFFSFLSSMVYCLTKNENGNFLCRYPTPHRTRAQMVHRGSYDLLSRRISKRPASGLPTPAIIFLSEC